MKYWGALKEFWGPLWGLLSGWAFLSVPGIGPVLVAGPLAGSTVATLDNAAVFGGLTALGAGLYSIGISREGVLACESAVRNGKYLVLVYGTVREVSQAKSHPEPGHSRGTGYADASWRPARPADRPRSFKVCLQSLLISDPPRNPEKQPGASQLQFMNEEAEVLPHRRVSKELHF